MANHLPFKQGLIFDLDGTLVDSLADISTAINLTRKAMLLAPISEEEIIRHVGDGTAHLVRHAVGVAEEQFAEAHRQYLAFYQEHLLDQTRLNEGVGEILERYRDRTLAVVTNKPIAQTEIILEGLAVRPCFRIVLGGDSLARKKPDPLPLNHLMEELKLRPEEVVMIGDGINDVKAGRAAGVMTIGLTSGVASREELEDLQPDYIINAIQQIPEVIS